VSVLEVAANPWYEKVFDHLEIVAEPVELAQATLHRQILVGDRICSER
jgi:hypothetical protein